MTLLATVTNAPAAIAALADYDIPAKEILDGYAIEITTGPDQDKYPCHEYIVRVALGTRLIGLYAEDMLEALKREADEGDWTATWGLPR